MATLTKAASSSSSALTVWVSDPKQVFVEAKLISQNDRECSVQLEDGQVVLNELTLFDKGDLYISWLYSD